MTGYIYFIQVQVGDKPIKIGYATRPGNRLSMLQAANAYDLVLVGLVSGTVEQENKLHLLLKDYWIRNEWFRSEVLTEDFRITDNIDYEDLAIIGVSADVGASLTAFQEAGIVVGVTSTNGYHKRTAVGTGPIRRVKSKESRQCANYANCGNEIPYTMRSDSKFCSDACRNQYWHEDRKNQ